MRHIKKDRFWSKISIKSKNECWEWQAYTGGRYGRFKMDGKLKLSHRVAYEFTYGPISKGLCVLHRCDNMKCCNPSHLFLGTSEDNIHDMYKKKRNNNVSGDRCGASKLNHDQILEIRKKYSTGDYTNDQLGKEYGVAHQQISRIVNKINWRHV